MVVIMENRRDCSFSITLLRLLRTAQRSLLLSHQTIAGQLEAYHLSCFRHVDMKMLHIAATLLLVSAAARGDIARTIW